MLAELKNSKVFTN